MRKRSGGDDTNDPGTAHEEIRPASLKRDEDHVKTLISYIQDNMTNPFVPELHPNTLINISTGMHATNEVMKSLLESVDVGNDMAKKFIEGSFSSSSNKSFYSAIARSGVKTFEDMTKTTNLKCKSGDIVKAHINPETIFRRALVLSGCRDDVTVEKVLSYPVGPIPTSLFHDDGTMRKTCKADLCHLLESETISVCQSLPQFDISDSVLIRDGMALFQAMNAKQIKTFGEFALQYTQTQRSLLEIAHVIVDVFDRYDLKNSIKSAERERRSKSKSSTIRTFDVIEGRALPDWKKFMSSNANKQSLIKFIGEFTVSYYERTGKSKMNQNQSVIMAGVFGDPEVVKEITVDGIQNLTQLFSSHEEADTRIVLHALHADRMFKNKGTAGRIVVKSPDTDVLVLLVHFYSKMTNTKELWFQTGSVGAVKDHRRNIPVHEICPSLSSIVQTILPAVHALSGCDTTSGFFGIGKKSVYRVIKGNPERYQNLHEIGNSDIDTGLDLSRQLVSTLYDPKSKTTGTQLDLNKLRVKLSNSKDCSLVRLPPSEAAFRQHVLRASIQTKIWMTADEPKPPPVSPISYGWKEGSYGLEPVLFEGPMSSDFLQDLICQCKGKSVCSKSCVCFSQSLSCTDLCSCQGSETCCNPNTHFDENPEDL